MFRVILDDFSYNITSYNRSLWRGRGDQKLPSGNIAIENGPVEIVSFPIKNGDFPLLC